MLIIINPTSGKRFQVALHDLENQIDWHTAEKSCSDIGNGLRLPTKDELKLIYEKLYIKGIGNFKAGIYWSGSEDGKEKAWYFVFGSGGSVNKRNKTSTFHARAVRSL